MTRRLAPLALLPLSILLATTCNRTDGAAAEPATPTGETTLPQAAPRARLRLSGFMSGHLEPCGCASGQLGGLPRRVFSLRQDPDYDLLIEGGNLVADGTPLSAAKMVTALTVLSMQAGYHVLALGADDLQLPLDELTTYLEAFPIVTISSDLVAPEGLTWPVVPSLEKAAGDAVVRIASLTLAKPAGTAGERFTLLPPAEAWRRAIGDAADDSYRVLLVHGTPDVARAQATLQPRPDLIIGITDDIAEPPSAPEPVAGVPLVFPGTRGRMLLDVTLARLDGVPRLTRYEVIRLQASETAKGALEDADAKLVLLDHRQQVKAEGIREQMAGRFPTANGASYVGSAECAECHEDSYDAWLETKHAHAWQTLEEAERGTRYGWPVTYYPDCVGCHVVGYGYESGFVNPEQTAALRNVGCEQCHGPGSEHVASGGDARMERGDVNSCLQCHDFEQSPDFIDHYAERWQKIEHYLDK